MRIASLGVFFSWALRLASVLAALRLLELSLEGGCFLYLGKHLVHCRAIRCVRRVRMSKIKCGIVRYCLGVVLCLEMAFIQVAVLKSLKHSFLPSVWMCGPSSMIWSCHVVFMFRIFKQVQGMWLLWQNEDGYPVVMIDLEQWAEPMTSNSVYSIAVGISVWCVWQFSFANIFQPEEQGAKPKTLKTIS